HFTVGGHYACGIHATDSSLQCFGQGGNNIPKALTDPSPWRDVSSGNYHACGVKTDGSAYCWGNNGGGELGSDVGPSTLAPTRVGTESDWFTVAVSDSHSCGLRGSPGNGTLWCWGDVFVGPATSTPTQVGTDADWLDVDVDATFGCALKGSG